MNRSTSSLDKVDDNFSDNIDNNISSLKRKKTISWNKDLVDLDTYSANSRSMTSSVFKDDDDINPTPCQFKHKYWIKHFDIDESLFQLCIPETLDVNDDERFDTDIDYNDIKEDDNNSMNRNKNNDYVLIEEQHRSLTAGFIQSHQLSLLYLLFLILFLLEVWGANYNATTTLSFNRIGSKLQNIILPVSQRILEIRSRSLFVRSYSECWGVTKLAQARFLEGTK